jgi:hypothetical protein
VLFSETEESGKLQSDHFSNNQKLVELEVDSFQKIKSWCSEVRARDFFQTESQ